MELLYDLDSYILLALWALGIPVGAFAFIHALLQRADAFTAAEKLTKPAWLGITGGGLGIMLLARPPYILFWLIGLVAVLVYLVDVRPRVVEVQRGPRW